MEFLDRELLDNTVRSYLVVAGTIVLVLLFKSFLTHQVIRLLCFIIQKFAPIKKETFRDMIMEPLSWALVITVSVISFDKLNFPDFWKLKIYGVSLQNVLNQIGTIAIILSVMRFLLKLMDFIAYVLLQRAGADDKNDIQIVNFFRDFLKIVLGIIGLIWLIHSGFNRDVSKILTGLSIVGAALALAAKESLENLIASFIIFFDKPFYVGDVLKVNNVTGTVEKIGLRSTRIRTGEKTLVTIPNKQMVDSVVDNLSMRTQRRGVITLELNPKSSGYKVKQLTDFCKQHLYADKEMIEDSNVYVSDFNKNAISIQIEFFTVPFSMNELNAYKEKFIFELQEKMEALDLDMSSTSDIRIVQNEGPVPPKPNPII
ncbi:MAG TPA: mechanosensitive ion channel family protein [Ferruginibacter sp.]|nr:mechanosensitive ion channel family protein [Ferruginibacter sp.]